MLSRGWLHSGEKNESNLSQSLAFEPLSDLTPILSTVFSLALRPGCIM